MANITAGKENRRQHFLFQLFAMDKEEHPMNPERAEALLQRMKRIFTKERERKGYGTGIAD